MRRTFFIAVVLLPYIVLAQGITVQDKSTYEAIPYVSVTNRSGTTVLTDIRGKAGIDVFSQSDSITFFHTSYNRKTLSPEDIRRNNYRVLLTAKVVPLSEVVLSVNRFEEKKKDVPYQVDIIKSRKVELLNPQTSADMLQQSANVLVQKSQMGGGSPIIRGFEASRVLIVLDGVRLNNAIYRSGHLQDVITIDNSMLKRTEVVYGPSSVMYGSDALGGVMHFYTKDALFSDADSLFATGNAGLRYSSANDEHTAHFDLNLGFKKIAFITSITHSDFGHLRTGYGRNTFPGFGETPYYVKRVDGKDSIFKNDDVRVQRFTGYRQMDLMEKISLRIHENVTQNFLFNFSTSSDIPRFDRLQQYRNGKPRYAEWNYGPQKRIFASSLTEIQSENNILFDNLRIALAWQDINQDRHTRNLNDTLRKEQLDNVKVYSINADFRKNIREKNEVSFGTEAVYNDVSSHAFWRNVNNDQEVPLLPADTRYPGGGSSMSSAAVYFSDTYKHSDVLSANAGLRFNYVGLRAEFNDTVVFNFPFKQTRQDNTALNGNLGLIFMPENNIRFSLLFSSGFRAPNVDDLGKVFDSSPGSIVVPNPDLGPETAFNYEGGMEYHFNERVEFEAAYFFTRLKNAIVITDFRYNGLDTMLYMGVPSRVMAAQNADEASVQGISAWLYGDIDEHFSFKATFNYTHGNYHDREKDTILPMDHIPPIFGQLSLMQRYNRVESEIYLMYCGAKALKDYSPSGEDNLATATPNGMPGWVTLNVKTGIQIHRVLRLNLGVENIFDTHYRVFASGISAPGRNFVVALRARL